MIQIMGGRAHYGVTTLGPVLPFIKEGKLVALAVSTPQRSSLLPDVPTIIEVLPEFKRTGGADGLLAPAGTPLPILNQLSKEIARIFDLPDMKQLFTVSGWVPATTTPEEFDKILCSWIEIMSKLVVDIGLKAK